MPPKSLLCNTNVTLNTGGRNAIEVSAWYSNLKIMWCLKLYGIAAKRASLKKSLINSRP